MFCYGIFEIWQIDLVTAYIVIVNSGSSRDSLLSKSKSWKRRNNFFSISEEEYKINMLKAILRNILI